MAAVLVEEYFGTSAPTTSAYRSYFRKNVILVDFEVEGRWGRWIWGVAIPDR
jgi:hypothetical protein